MESEYSGSLESVWGINTTSTTSSDRFSIVASPAVAVPQPRPPGFPYCTFAPRQNPLVGQSPPVVPVASRPFSVFPPFSGTQTVPRPIASPPSGDPVIPVENLIDTSVSLNVTPNQTEFRAWINGRVHPSFGMKDTMVHYISRMLDMMLLSTTLLNFSSMTQKTMNRIQVTDNHCTTICYESQDSGVEPR